MPERRQPNVAVISIIVIVLLAGATVGTIALTKKSDSDNNGSSQTNTQNESSNNTSSEANSAAYEDGTYTKTGTYTTPGGQESVTVTVTLADGVITSTSTEGSGSNGNTVEYQGKFIAGYKDLVVGKKIDEVSLSRVSGSSLTSTGFNHAIDAIKEDAQSS
jgi:uncharacterized protein with FMN-binding domain